MFAHRALPIATSLLAVLAKAGNRTINSPSQPPSTLRLKPGLCAKVYPLRILLTCMLCTSSCPLERPLTQVAGPRLSHPTASGGRYKKGFESGATLQVKCLESSAGQEVGNNRHIHTADVGEGQLLQPVHGANALQHGAGVDASQLCAFDAEGCERGAAGCLGYCLAQPVCEASMESQAAQLLERRQESQARRFQAMRSIPVSRQLILLAC